MFQEIPSRLVMFQEIPSLSSKAYWDAYAAMKADGKRLWPGVCALREHYPDHRLLVLRHTAAGIKSGRYTYWDGAFHPNAKPCAPVRNWSRRVFYVLRANKSGVPDYESEFGNVEHARVAAKAIVGWDTQASVAIIERTETTESTEVET